MIVLHFFRAICTVLILLVFGVVLFPFFVVFWALGVPLYIRRGTHKDVYRWFTKIRSEVLDDE
jgi:hypothetical protein